MRVELIRSRRRRRTITAERKGRAIVVRLPSGMPPAEEQDWVERMVERVTSNEQAGRLNAGRALERAADRLNHRHFAGDLRWRSIRYVTNQRDRFGMALGLEE